MAVNLLGQFDEYFASSEHDNSVDSAVNLFTMRD